MARLKRLKKIQLHREGTHTLVGGLFILLALNALVYFGFEYKWPFYILAVASLVVYGILVNFFRCPIRLFGQNTEKVVVAPADGKVVVVEEVDENEYFHDRRIMVSIFIGHDYRSGYVKQLFTTHAKKQDYMMSKSLTCAFAMACMCLTYLLGTVVSGLLMGASFEANVGSLLLAILGKMVMSLGWASLYTFLNVVFRRYFGISVALSFFFGTGILIIGAAAVLGNSPLLNLFLYGSSVNACLSSNIVTLLSCIVVSAVWAVIYNLAGTLLLKKSDVY